MTDPSIAGVRTGRRRVPLRRPWGPTVGDVTVIAVEVIDSDGARGHGFSWTPSIGGAAVQAMIDHDLGPWARGRPARPEIWRDAWQHLHEAGGGGVTTLALAGLDLALWDLVCRRAGTGLDERLGRLHDTQPAYGSGVNLHYGVVELVDQAARWMAAGFSAVKVKVGCDDLADDVARVRAVRDALGPDVQLMLDANQRWDLARATRAVDELAQFGITWFEEPLRADDTTGYAELRRRTGATIAQGENAHTWYRFRELIDAGACDVVQPNVVRVGGITPFLDIVGLARDGAVTLAPHLLVELSARLAVTLAEPTWVEVVEDAGFDDLGATSRPSGVTVTGGRVHVTPTVGIGIELRERP